MAPFRPAVVEQTTTVKVGYMSKPQAVSAIMREEGLFIHVTVTSGWVCRALTGTGRSTAPLKGQTHFLERLSRVSLRGLDENSAPSVVDPMEELRGGMEDQEDQGDEFETPRKRSRKRLTMAQREFVTRVRLSDVVDELAIFQGRERDQVAQGSVLLLVKQNRRRSVYVLDKDIDICMLVMLRQLERMGVPHVDLPDENSALAEASEWFDARTSRWHLRVRNSEEVLVSDPVRRTGADGKPLDATIFKRMKSAALAALKASPKYSS